MVQTTIYDINEKYFTNSGNTIRPLLCHSLVRSEGEWSSVNGELNHVLFTIDHSQFASTSVRRNQSIILILQPGSKKEVNNYNPVV